MGARLLVKTLLPGAVLAAGLIYRRVGLIYRRGKHVGLTYRRGRPYTNRRGRPYT